jgi:hypothetical protein
MANLDPRNLPRSYSEMLQDIIAMHEKMKKYDGTNSRAMAFALVPAVVLAQEQLKEITDGAIKRMFGTLSE